ncbi:intermembrane phospholipid transport protein YdbH family protein [Brevundimonas nasdae]|uniref:intermembrane phospholipid transport protein YdbH family protein n=1 Tax=Brevundimonas nasdae TaxID=172043 RepID=UPI003F693653
MTDNSSETAIPAPQPRKRAPQRRVRRLWLVLLGILVVAVVLTSALYLNRRAAAREVLVGWLDRRGIQADVDVQRLELDGFVGRIRIGDPRDPDVVVERVEVDYAIGMPWSKAGLGVTPSRIRLVRPVMRASWKDGKLSLGSLDPLIEEFTGGPPRPDSRGPLVIVEGGRGRLDTEYGPVQALIDARVDDGKLMRLKGQATAQALKSGDVAARDLKADVDLTTTGDRVKLLIDAGAAGFKTQALNGETAHLLLNGDLPYPDMKTRRGDGRAVIDAVLTGAMLGNAETSARDAALTARFDGAVSGWIETFRAEGATALSLKSSRIDGPNLQVVGADAVADGGRLALSQGKDFRWSLTTPLTLNAASGRAGEAKAQALAIRSSGLTMGGRNATFELTGAVGTTAGAVGFGDLSLKRARSTLNLDVVYDGATRISAEGSVASDDGAWPLFGLETRDEVAELKAMKRALGGFAFSAPALRFSTGTGGTDVVLARPATLSPRNGGVLTIAQAGQAVYQAEPGRAGGGALQVNATRGEGLPELAIAVPEWRLTDAGFEAHLDGRAKLDFDLARGIDAQTKGVLAMTNGRLTYVADDCVALTVERLAMEENDVRDIAGKLCPGAEPLLTSKDGVWHVAAGVQDFEAQAPFLAMRFSGVGGTLAVDGASSGVGLTAKVAEGRVSDTTDPQRFTPLAASGEVQLANERWSGGFDLKGAGQAASARLGRLTLAHDGRTGAGGIQISAPDIVFAEHGLQPDMLSPLVEEFIQSPVVGAIGFAGRFDWTKGGEPTSSGRLTVPGLDFTSPAGAVKGLKGDIVLTSLTPLITAPDQELTIEAMEIGTDVTALNLKFDLDANGLNVAGGQVNAAGGTIALEPFVIPLDIEKGFNGVIVLDRVQLGDVVADTGFDDKVLLDAVVSGRLPFTYDPKNGLKIVAGSLGAVQPGKLSIKREVLTDVSAGGAGEDVPPNMVEDLAYQAMENLSFDLLTADVNSMDGGRVAVLFHIRGDHNPPKRQELRLTISELISRKFLNRTLPLPSGTKIDLTLDTTLNANQLISDLLRVNRARNGQQDEPQ